MDDAYRDSLQVGKEVPVSVLEIDHWRHRIALGLKGVPETPVVPSVEAMSVLTNEVDCLNAGKGAEVPNVKQLGE